MIIACGLYLLSGDGKQVRRKCWIHNVFSAKEEEGEYHILFGRLYDNRQKLFKCFKNDISKFENFKKLLP